MSTEPRDGTESDDAAKRLTEIAFEKVPGLNAAKLAKWMGAAMEFSEQIEMQLVGSWEEIVD